MYSALNIIVNGLGAQTAAFNNISSNVANVHSDSYKEVDTHFKPLVSESIHYGNGVKSYRVNTIEVQGQLRDTGIDTNIAIDGKGMFVVSHAPDDEEVLFTRLGSFDKDKEGYLVNGEGAYLKGWKVQKEEVDIFKSGSVDSLENINLDKIGDEASSTTELSLSLNLNAGEEIKYGQEYQVKPQSTYNMNNHSDDIIYPDQVKSGDSFHVVTSDGASNTFTYGGFNTSNLLDNKHPMLGAQTIYDDFSSLKNGEKLILNNDTAGDITFTYSKYNADPYRGSFNNLLNLCEAIDLRKEYSARLTEGQLYVTPQDGAHTVKFTNGIAQEEFGISSELNSLYRPTQGLNSYVMSDTSPLYEATDPSQKFQYVQDGEEITIQLSDGKKFDFQFNNLGDANSFNSLQTLGDAIQKTDLNASIINGNQLKIEVDQQRSPDLAIISCKGGNGLAARLGIEVDSTFKDTIKQGDNFEVALGAHNDVIADKQISTIDQPFTQANSLQMANGDTLNITLNNGQEYQFSYKENMDGSDFSFNSLYNLQQAIAETPLKVAIENGHLRISSDENTIKEITGKAADHLGLAVKTENLQLKFSGPNGGSLNGQPDSAHGEFNDILTLAQALNQHDSLKAEIINKGQQLKINSNDQSKILYINDIKGDIASQMNLQQADLTSALGLQDLEIPHNTFSTLGGLSRLINEDGRFIAQSNNDGLSIFADDMLSTVSFHNSPHNSADLLGALGLSDKNLGPKYEPLSSNMASGQIKPSFSHTTKVYDSLGTSHNLYMSYLKFAPNHWGMEISVNPDEVDNHRGDGLLAYANLEFGGDGKIADIDFHSLENGSNDQAVNIQWANKADDGEIAFNLGKDDIKQFSANYNVYSLDQDGYEMGDVKRVFIDENGIINGVFSNGTTRQLYQIPLVDFPNINGLTIEAHNMYSLGKDSGDYRLRIAGEGNAGSIVPEMLEGSNVTLSEEITKIIKTKHAYQMHSKVMQTADRLLEEITKMINA